MSCSTSEGSIFDGRAPGLKPSRPAVETRLHHTFLDALEPALDLAFGDLPLVGDVRAGRPKIGLDIEVKLGVRHVGVQKQLTNEVGVFDIFAFGVEYAPEVAMFADQFDGGFRPDTRHAIVEIGATENSYVDETLPREVVSFERGIEIHAFGIATA